MEPLGCLSRRVSLIVMTLLASGCAGADTFTSPSNELNVTNTPGEFRFQSRYQLPTTQTFTYAWLTSGTNIEASSTGRPDSGLARLSVIDPRGNRLLGRTDTPQVSAFFGFFPLTGIAGTWTIEVQLEAVTGVVDYRVIGGALP